MARLQKLLYWQKIQIVFENLKVKCNVGDTFTLYNQNRAIIMDYCKSIKKKVKINTTVITNSKYVHLRLSTLASEYIGLRFNFNETDVNDEKSLDFQKQTSAKLKNPSSANKRSMRARVFVLVEIFFLLKISNQSKQIVQSWAN